MIQQFGLPTLQLCDEKTPLWEAQWLFLWILWYDAAMSQFLACVIDADTDYRRRLCSEVPTWYITCPLHPTHRSCVKTMQENMGGRHVVVRKLLFWMAQGYFIEYDWDNTYNATHAMMPCLVYFQSWAIGATKVSVWWRLHMKAMKMSENGISIELQLGHDARWSLLRFELNLFVSLAAPFPTEEIPEDESVLPTESELVDLITFQCQTRGLSS